MANERDVAEVVYEDDDVIVFFKPAGMIVQGNQGSTLEQWAASTSDACLHFVSDPECWRQREQKGVSGLVLALKNQTPPQTIDEHVRLQIQRKYCAVVAGPVAQDRLFLSKDAGVDAKENGTGLKGKKRGGKREQLRAAARAKWKISINGTAQAACGEGATDQDARISEGTSCLSELQAETDGVGLAQYEEAALEDEAVQETEATVGRDEWGTWVQVLERGESPECLELCIVEIWPGRSRDVGASEDGSRGIGSAWPPVEHININVHDARQMRRSMLAAGHAVVGQRAIGKCRQLDDCRGTYLSCTSLRFMHPTGGQEMVFHRQPPLKFRSLLDRHSRSVQRQRERERNRDATGEAGGGDEQGAVRSVVFCGLAFESNDQVFVPRAGTAETVVQRAQELISVMWGQRWIDGANQGRAGEGGGDAAEDDKVDRAGASSDVRVLDLGTGSGCLLIAALHAVSVGRAGQGGLQPPAGDARGTGVLGVGLDNDEAAIRLAARNAENLGMSTSTKWVCADFGRLHQAEVRSQLGSAAFDMILLAPPESAEHKWGRPRWEMRGHEPRSATVAGPTGLEGYTSVMASLAQCDPPLLATGGWLLVRANSRSHHAVRQLFQRERERFEETDVVRDSRGVKCGLILRYKGGKGVGARGSVGGIGDDGGRLCGVKIQRFDAFEDALDFLLAAVSERGDGDGGVARGGQASQAGGLREQQGAEGAGGGPGGSRAGVCAAEVLWDGDVLSNGKVIWLLGEMLQRPLTADEKRRARTSGFRVAPAKWQAAGPVDGYA